MLKRLVALMVFAAGGTVSGLSEAQAPTDPLAKPAIERAPVPVRVAAVEEAPAVGIVTGSGLLSLKRELGLSFKIGGVLASYAVDIGDRVKEGQVLAALDQREIEARAKEAEAGLARAEIEYKRARELVARGAVSQARLDDAKAARDQARARRDVVVFDKSYSQLVAPADGLVLTRPAAVGEIVQPGQTVLSVGDRTSGLILTVALSDRDVARISVGNGARVTFATRPDGIEGKVARIAGKADPRTGAFDVEIVLTDGGQGLLSGMIGRAEIMPAAAPGSTSLLSVPVESVLEGDGMQGSVFVIDPANQVATRREVRVVSLRGPDVVLSGGLAVGETVVTAGAAYLSDGDSVSIVRDGDLFPNPQ